MPAQMNRGRQQQGIHEEPNQAQRETEPVLRKAERRSTLFSRRESLSHEGVAVKVWMKVN